MSGSADHKIKRIIKIIVIFRISIILLAGVSSFYLGINQLRSNEVFSENPKNINEINLKEYLDKTIHLKGLSKVEFPRDNFYLSLAGKYYPAVVKNKNNMQTIQVLFYGAALEHSSNEIDLIRKRESTVVEIQSMNLLSLSEKKTLTDSYLMSNEGVLIRVVEYQKYWWVFLIIGLLVFLLGFYLIIHKQVKNNNSQWNKKSKADVYPSYSLQ